MVDLAARAAGRAQVMLAAVILTRGRDPSYFDPYRPIVQAAREALQAAALFADHGLVSPDGVARVAWRLRAEWGWAADQVETSLADLTTRKLVSDALVDQVRETLEQG
jgi:hypothetical protein